MNISSTSAFQTESSFSVGASTAASQASQGRQRPDQQAALASALETIGVDAATATDVLSQVEEAIDAAKSGSSSSGLDQSAVRSVIAGVLEKNGIDPAEVGDAIRDSLPTSGTQASGATEQAGGPRAGGRPQGPPPPPAGSEEDEVSSVESALLASNLDEVEVDDLLSQMIEAISSLSSNEATEVTSESIRKVMTEVLEQNDVNVERFEQALQGELGGSGSFFNRVA